MCLYFSNLFFKARSFYLNYCTGPSLPLEKCRVNNTRSSSSLVLLNILWSFQKMKKRFTVKFVFRFGWRVCLLYEWCSRKSLFELSEASVHWCFEKITAPKISFLHTFHTFQRNIQGGVLLTILSGLPGVFPKSSSEQLFCREPVFLCKKELCSTRYLRNFAEF